jgi:hypothetical protein
MYCLFVDISKAFDYVQHQLLFYMLLKNGVSCKLITLLRTIYDQLKACVRTTDGLSEYFSCNIGTRQSCMLSHLLFVFFLNECITMLEASGCKGIYISEDAPNLLKLIFADDMVNAADTVLHMQRQILVLEQFCDKYGMKVYMEKINVVVFTYAVWINRVLTINQYVRI